jgi:toxin ParE1/3/4
MSSRYTLSLTPSARADLKDILRYGVKIHGRKTAQAYEALIKAAFRQIVADPYRPGSKDRPEIAEGARSYHIALAKVGMPSPVGSPRHVVFCFVPGKGRLVVGRILHDARDPARFMADIRRPDKDKPILGAAMGAGCAYLVTGDKRVFGHLYGKTVEGVTVLNYLDFAEIMLKKHA